MNKIEQLETALKILRAEEAGKPLEWEFQPNDGSQTWLEPANGAAYYLFTWQIRIKPWTLCRTVNGHTLPDGEEWHRNDWTEEMLPPPYRPLILGERRAIGDEHHTHVSGWFPCKEHPSMQNEASQYWDHCRTTRPILKPSILTDEQKAAGWVEWHGGKNPIPGKWCKRMYRSGEIGERVGLSDEYRWSSDAFPNDIIAYLVVKTEWVDLGPEDVPPGSELKAKQYAAATSVTIIGKNSDGVWYRRATGEHCFVNYTDLKAESYKINRSLSTGKWNPDAWEPCEKEK